MPKSLSHTFVHFSVDLHKQLLRSRKDKQDNVICSPFSIAAALSMALGGAGANTAEEIYDVLHAKDHRMHERFALFLPKLSSHSHRLQFHIANRIYSDKKFPIQSSYAKFLNTSYGSTILPVDFEKSHESILTEINDWLKTVTESKITNFLAAGTISPSTSLILVSAIYFMGLWEWPFLASSTSRSDFNVNVKTKVQVDMMYQKQDFPISHSDELKARALEVLYRGGKASMVILLQDEMKRLSHLKHHLTASRLCAILSDLKDTPDIKLSLPKLVLQQCVNLKDVLMEMGIKDLFSVSCDLSEMFMQGKPTVSNVVHKAFLQADEEGTEAASATAAELCKSIATEAPQVTVFTVNHPFMLLLKKHKSDVTLFMASMRKP